jgi:hypothetical protein
MDLADRLTFIGMGVIAVVFGFALWTLGGKRPHIRWLEFLQRKNLGPRQQIALMIAAAMGLMVMMSIAVQTYSRAHR